MEGNIEGHAVLGAPVSLEPLAIDGYAVEGVSEGESVGVAVGATLGTSVGECVGWSVGATEGHAVLGAPVSLEPLAIDGYAVEGVSEGVRVG